MNQDEIKILIADAVQRETRRLPEWLPFLDPATAAYWNTELVDDLDE